MNAYSSGIDRHSDNNVTCVVDQDGRYNFDASWRMSFQSLSRYLNPFEDSYRASWWSRRSTGIGWLMD